MPTASAERQLAPDNRVFQFLTQPQMVKEGSGAAVKRKFSGIGYSGQVIPNHFYWGDVIFDLHTMSVNSSLPALVDHDRSQRAGYVTDHTISDERGLEVSGVLMTNEAGSAVAQESDDGFPWQMSVHIDPGSIEEISSGVTTVVNGKTLSGPLTVFRNSRIAEVSFTATGYDANTSATAMSRPSGGPSQQTSTGEFSMTPEQIAAMQAENARLSEENKTLTAARDAAQADLAKFSKDRRESDIKNLFSETGREFKSDDSDVNMLFSLPQGAFDFTAKQMRDASKASEQTNTASNQAHLFSHQAASGTSGAPTPAANPLKANAEARKAAHAQFAKR